LARTADNEEEEQAMATIDRKFLVPATGDKEVIILTDSKRSASVLMTKADSMVLSDRATELLRKSYLMASPQRLEQAAGASAIKDAQLVSWVQQSADAQLFRLTLNEPRVTKVKTRAVKAGDSISEATFGTGGPIIVDRPGQLRTRTVNRVNITWFAADGVFEAAPASGFIGSAGTPRGPVGSSLFPKPAGDVTGVNCTICAVCGACGACGACGPSPAVALAIVAVDAVVGVAGASASFETLRTGLS
jgi:hypothetical protein